MLSQSIEPFGPATMQFNSIAVKDTDELLRTINWINENCTKRRTIFWGKTLRGWMEIKLQEDRSFLYYSDTSGSYNFGKLPIRELLLFGSLITIIRKREWDYNQAGLP